MNCRSAPYRLYFFGPSNAITRVKEIKCADDAEAEAIAQSHAGPESMELCHGDRCIRWFASRNRPRRKILRLKISG
jgi:hypothetical protein